MTGSRTVAIIVHGGAYAIPDDVAPSSVLGCEAAAEIGYQILIAGGSALDAVEAAVNSLEDDPIFDAGTGSVLNEYGEVEMDAIIMDGKTLKSGAVAGVQCIKNPVSLARKVMDVTPHSLLVGAGANKFAEKMGIKRVRMEDLVTPAAVHELATYKQYNLTVSELFNRPEAATKGNAHPLVSALSGHDTVGAVALDSLGNMAAATSTGGITAKMAGRVGDSPLIGCGAYADNLVGGVSCTGHGESIMKVTLARSVNNLMEMCGLPAREAAEAALDRMRTRVGGCGGCIVITPSGSVAHAFTTPRMAWATYSNGALTSAYDR